MMPASVDDLRALIGRTIKDVHIEFDKHIHEPCAWIVLVLDNEVELVVKTRVEVQPGKSVGKG